MQETLHYDPALGRDHVAALQGGGARLPLLPRARPAAGGDRRGDGRGGARGDARAAGAARRALRARAGAERRQRAAAGLPQRARRLLRGGAGGRRPTRRAGAGRWPTGCSATSPSRLGEGEDPARLASAAGGAGRARRPRRGQARERRRRAPGARQARGRGRRAIRRRSSRPRGWARWAATTTSWARSSRRRWRRTPTPPSGCARGNEKAIGPIVGAVMRETKGRADGARGHAAGARAARHLSTFAGPARGTFWTWAKGSAGPPRQDAAHELGNTIDELQASRRRFILLPEESVNGHGQRPRIRRYQLTSVGQRPCASGVDGATARIAGELGRRGRM